jgi:hypothetical protein
MIVPNLFYNKMPKVVCILNPKKITYYMEDDFQRNYENYSTLAFQRRGIIVNETILLERLIDYYIADHFCKDDEKRAELMETIICTNRMIFENKIQVLKFLLEKHNKKVIDEHPKMIKDILEIIIPERNIFAHYWLVTTEEISGWVTTNKTVFIKYKNATEYIEYDTEKVSKIVSLINKYIKVFMELQK